MDESTVLAKYINSSSSARQRGDGDFTWAYHVLKVTTRLAVEHEALLDVDFPSRIALLNTVWAATVPHDGAYSDDLAVVLATNQGSCYGTVGGGCQACMPLDAPSACRAAR
jgi:hypothetical protein